MRKVAVLEDAARQNLRPQPGPRSGRRRWAGRTRSRRPSSGSCHRLRHALRTQSVPRPPGRGDDEGRVGGDGGDGHRVPHLPLLRPPVAQDGPQRGEPVPRGAQGDRVDALDHGGRSGHPSSIPHRTVSDFSRRVGPTGCRFLPVETSAGSGGASGGGSPRSVANGTMRRTASLVAASTTGAATPSLVRAEPVGGRDAPSITWAQPGNRYAGTGVDPGRSLSLAGARGTRASSPRRWCGCPGLLRGGVRQEPSRWKRSAGPFRRVQVIAQHVAIRHGSSMDATSTLRHMTRGTRRPAWPWARGHTGHMPPAPTQLSLGVLGRSRKENEHRLPLHPRHLSRIPEDLRAQIYVESGYGSRFGARDDELAGAWWAASGRVSSSSRSATSSCSPSRCWTTSPSYGTARFSGAGRTASRTEPSPSWRSTSEADPHRLRGDEPLDHGTDSFSLHVFHKNNELAGYCSVLHAMQISGSTGDYGPRLRAVVIGFGATARGAVTALTALGVNDVDVLTHRRSRPWPPPSTLRVLHFDGDETTDQVRHAVHPDGRCRSPEFLGEHDIIVNCVLQDTDRPLVFVTDEDLPSISPRHGGRRRLLRRGDGLQLGAPHDVRGPDVRRRSGRPLLRRRPQPVYLWNAATWEISEALLPFLQARHRGDRRRGTPNRTVDRAIEVRGGVVQNAAILSFQGRSPNPPHHPLSG